ncbi:hypothetical protein K402DRAFT_401355 [Aulographum hederae CBS 113979]|uniref:Fork-head domain-containing protein n=1 Tax=Aulographum hederae CBS 113979 TaxID=1176131 RepID=A0A6G1HBZ6_9PEZI|nr:hypothetical protein K402DRAFT_401355 [Aulographum hederae CBS 113979]
MEHNNSNDRGHPLTSHAEVQAQFDTLPNPGGLENVQDAASDNPFLYSTQYREQQPTSAQTPESRIQSSSFSLVDQYLLEADQAMTGMDSDFEPEPQLTTTNPLESASDVTNQNMHFNSNGVFATPQVNIGQTSQPHSFQINGESGQTATGDAGSNSSIFGGFQHPAQVSFLGIPDSPHQTVNMAAESLETDLYWEARGMVMPDEEMRIDFLHGNGNNGAEGASNGNYNLSMANAADTYRASSGSSISTTVMATDAVPEELDNFTSTDSVQPNSCHVLEQSAPKDPFSANQDIPIATQAVQSNSIHQQEENASEDLSKSNLDNPLSNDTNITVSVHAATYSALGNASNTNPVAAGSIELSQTNFSHVAEGNVTQVAATQPQENTADTGITGEPPSSLNVQISGPILIQSHDMLEVGQNEEHAIPQSQMNASSNAATAIAAATNPPETDNGVGEGNEARDILTKEERAAAGFVLPELLDDGTYPKLTIQQLLVVALAQSPERRLRLQNIMEWMTRTFRKYRLGLVQAALKVRQPAWMIEALEHLYELDGVFEICNLSASNDLFYLPPGKEWLILPSPCQNRGSSTPSRGFLDLPYDVKIGIYKKLFKFSGDLTFPKSWHAHTDIRLFSSFEGRNTSRKLFLPSMKSILAILRVKKEIRAEAYPLFFHWNRFKFDDTVPLYHFLNSIGPKSRLHISSVEFTYDLRSTPHLAGDALELLSESKRLKHLTIIMDEKVLFARPNSKPQVKFFPGFHHLFYMRGIKHVDLGPEGENMKTKRYLKLLLNPGTDMGADSDQELGKQRIERNRKHLREIRERRNARKASPRAEKREEAKVEKEKEKKKIQATRKRQKTRKKNKSAKEKAGKTAVKAAKKASRAGPKTKDPEGKQPAATASSSGAFMSNKQLRNRQVNSKIERANVRYESESSEDGDEHEDDGDESSESEEDEQSDDESVQHVASSVRSATAGDTPKHPRHPGARTASGVAASSTTDHFSENDESEGETRKTKGTRTCTGRRHVSRSKHPDCIDVD